MLCSSSWNPHTEKERERLTGQRSFVISSYDILVFWCITWKKIKIGSTIIEILQNKGEKKRARKIKIVVIWETVTSNNRIIFLQIYLQKC